MNKIIFVTGNKNKLLEAQAMIKNYEVSNHNLDLEELQGTAEEIVIAKAKLAYKTINGPCFVEDSSVSFKAWNGLPGPYVKDFAKAVGVDNFSQLLTGQNKTAIARAIIGYAKSEDEVLVFVGEIEGEIVEPKGSDRFGWDRVFMPKGYDIRFSEMGVEEKNRISHRRKAFEKFNVFLNS